MDKHIYKYLVICIAVFVCYYNTLWGTFVFDDSEAIVKNKDVMPYTPIREIFKNDFWGTDITSNSSHKSYRPLTILSYRLNVLYSDNKLDAYQFHITNVFLYGLLCLFMIPIFKLYTKKCNKEIHDAVYFSSLLFSVHPVHTESVAGLVGRADILSSILFCAVLLMYQQMRILPLTVFLLFPLIMFTTACAVLCKETAVTVMGMLVVHDIYKEKKKYMSWWDMCSFWYFFRYILLILPAIGIMFFRFKVMNFEGPIFTSLDNPAAYSESLFTRVFMYNYVYLLNFLLLLWPQWLCFDWSMGCIPLIETVYDVRVYFVMLFWLLIMYSLFLILRRIYFKGILDARIMAIFLMVLPFLPASNLFFTVGFVIAERTLLLPSAGFCLLVGTGLKKLERYSKNKNVSLFIFYYLLLVFSLRTIQRNMNWLTEEKLFSSALEVCPLNAKVHYNIAKVASDKNDKALALIEYRKAIELNPNYEQAMNNLANLLREDMKFREAEIFLRKALKVRPNFAAAWMNLGIVLTNLNQSEEAEHCYKMAIMHRNKYPDCYYNLGNLYLDLKRNEEALKAWEMAVLYRPKHVAAWSNTLVLLDTMKKFDDVLELGRTALMHNPKSPALHFSLANTLGKIQQFEKAEGHFLEAINLNPENGLYYSNLGVLYHRWGKTDKAREMYKKALLINPNMKSTELNLKKLSDAQ